MCWKQEINNNDNIDNYLIFQKLKEEEEERQAQSRILQLLKDKDVTKDFLAYVEDRNKYGLSLIPETVFCEHDDAYSVGTPAYDFQVEG